MTENLTIQTECKESKKTLELENRLKLPVSVTKSGTIFVLDASGRQARVFTGGFSPARQIRKKQVSSLWLILRYPAVSRKAAIACIEKITKSLTGLRSIYITIDSGPIEPNWPELEKLSTELVSFIRKKKIIAGITINGVFEKPKDKYVDWLAANRIVARYILGPSLGYSGEIDEKTAGRLKAMSDEGLRVPVLFYWSNQSYSQLRQVLGKALQMNKLAGIGILPHFMSPYFDCRKEADGPSGDPDGFKKVVDSLYADRMFCEHIDEPVSDIERRLGNSPAADCARAIISENGDLLLYRQFPFAARQSRIVSTSSVSKFIAPVSGRCEKCAWKNICGGIDLAPPAFRQQYKTTANAWCRHRKALMRRVVGECMEIREHLYRVQGLREKEAKK